MKQKKDARERILKTALKEFSTHGFSGARMDRIANSAKVNKAMIFYYFSSKENLYQQVVIEILNQMSPIIIQLILSNPSAEEFLEQITELYVNLFSKNPEFVRMVMLELILNPKNITAIVSQFFKEKMEKEQRGPMNLLILFNKWQEENAITEDDPYQFMLNVVSLSLLSFLGKPFIDTIFQLAPVYKPQQGDFYKKRIKSVVNVLKRGMLP